MASVTVHGFQLQDAILHHTDLVIDLTAVINQTADVGYGEIYIDDNAATQTFTLQNTWYQLAGPWANGISNQFTPDAGSANITCNKQGVYRINCVINYIGAANKTFEFGVFINAVEQVHIEAHSVPRGAGNIICTTISGLHQLAVGDVIDVRGQCITSAGEVITLVHCNLSII